MEGVSIAFSLILDGAQFEGTITSSGFCVTGEMGHKIGFAPLDCKYVVTSLKQAFEGCWDYCKVPLSKSDDGKRPVLLMVFFEANGYQKKKKKKRKRTISIVRNSSHVQ